LIHTQFHQLTCHAKLFRDRDAASGGLLTIPERRIEDIDPIAHSGSSSSSSMPDAGRFSKFIILWPTIINFYRMRFPNAGRAARSVQSVVCRAGRRYRARIFALPPGGLPEHPGGANSMTRNTFAF